MSLDNLIRTGQLKTHSSNALEIQCLLLTVGVAREDLLVLDALRKKRNINDYSGDLIDPESVRECLVRAEQLISIVGEWLEINHPHLLLD